MKASIFSTIGLLFLSLTAQGQSTLEHYRIPPLRAGSIIFDFQLGRLKLLQPFAPKTNFQVQTLDESIDMKAGQVFTIRRSENEIVVQGCLLNNSNTCTNSKVEEFSQPIITGDSEFHFGPRDVRIVGFQETLDERTGIYGLPTVQVEVVQKVENFDRARDIHSVNLIEIGFTKGCLHGVCIGSHRVNTDSNYSLRRLFGNGEKIIGVDLLGDVIFESDIAENPQDLSEVLKTTRTPVGDSYDKNQPVLDKLVLRTR